MKSPNVEGYISWSDIESSGIGSLDRIEVDADDDKQGITITIDSNFEGGFGTEASEKFDELVRKANTVVKFQWYEIEKIANEYKERIEKLKNNTFPV
jgi:hypothetical protein